MTQREEICYGTIIVADEQVVRGKGANIKIKRKIEKAVFKKSDTEWKGLRILEIASFKVVGYTNYSN
jgi:hypothetical protein